MHIPVNIFQQYLGYGLSVIPCNGKIPAVTTWKQYQTKRANGEAATWSGNIACICGAVSGGLIAVDFDVKNGDKWPEWLAIINEHYPEILSKLVIEKTPSGGYHVVFRSNKTIKNLKLARNKDNAATIETRGDGGYFVCAPSENYSLYYGDFEHIQKLSDEEAEIILSTAASLNEYREPEPEIPALQAGPHRPGLTPFDDYNQRHDIVGLLQSHGWRLLFVRNSAAYFQRPGKDGRGISATWNHVPDRFFVFSTATKFENNHIYKASAVYALLEHEGNFNAAAKALYAQGFGKIEEPQPKKAILIDSGAVRKRLFEIKAHGYQRGKTTGWPRLDRLYTVVKGQFTVVTGMPSHGKSEFVDAMAMNLSRLENWKFAMFSPENYPTEMHYHKLVEKYVGIPLHNIPDDDLNTAIDFISKHFFFIDAIEDEINLDMILEKTEELIKAEHVDGLIIDPWNEIELMKPRELSETEFIGACLRKSRKFARRNNIHLWMVVHPVKMIKDKGGNYPIPELYDCSGSAHWRNKADNGICVYRDLNIEGNETTIHIQKIKYRFAGKPGKCSLLYDLTNGTYSEPATASEWEDR